MKVSHEERSASPELPTAKGREGLTSLRLDPRALLPAPVLLLLLVLIPVPQPAAQPTFSQVRLTLRPGGVEQMAMSRCPSRNKGDAHQEGLPVVKRKLD